MNNYFCDMLKTVGGFGATNRKAPESIVTARWLHKKEVRGRAGVFTMPASYPDLAPAPRDSA